MRTWFVVFALCGGCGRVGFDTRLGDDQIPGDAAPDASPGTVTITVNGGSGDPYEGAPIADAYVVFVGDGTTEVVRTDGNGIASTYVPGATTIHVAYLIVATAANGAAEQWRVITYHGVGGGSSILVGSASDTGTIGSFTVNVPVAAGATSYSLAGPARCGIEGSSATPAITASFTGVCAGQSVPIYAFANDASSVTAWLDGGQVALVPAGTTTPSGGWQTSTRHRIRFDDFAAETEVSADLYQVRGTDVILVARADVTIPIGGMATVDLDGRSGAPDRLLVMVTDGPIPNGSGYIANIQAPAENAGERYFDAAHLPQAIDTLTVDPASQAAAWTYGPATGVPGVVAAIVREFSTPTGAAIAWITYAGASSTSSELPSLPPPLDELVPAGGSGLGGVVLIHFEGLDYARAVEHVDRNVSELGLRMAELPLGFAATLRVAVGALPRRVLLPSVLANIRDSPGSTSSTSGDPPAKRAPFALY